MDNSAVQLVLLLFKNVKESKQIKDEKSKRFIVEFFVNTLIEHSEILLSEMLEKLEETKKQIIENEDNLSKDESYAFYAKTLKNESEEIKKKYAESKEMYVNYLKKLLNENLNNE